MVKKPKQIAGAEREHGVPNDAFDVERVRQRIGAHRYLPIASGDSQIPFAVLVPFYELQGMLHVVLTKRTALMRRNQGHVSFPGGRREHDDPDLLATALRESHEEIGLDPGHVEVLGRVDDFSTRDGELFIAGFAGLIDPSRAPYPWRPAQTEVAEILVVPLTHLLDPANIDVAEPRLLNGRMWPNETFLFQGHRIFGATARALRHVLDILLAPSRA